MRIDKELLLSSDLMKLVLAGKKNTTVRLGRRSIVTPECFEIIDNVDENIKINASIVDIRFCRIGDMSENDLTDAGRDKTPSEYLINTLHPFYPDATLDEEVSIIKFKVI